MVADFALRYNVRNTHTPPLLLCWSASALPSIPSLAGTHRDSTLILFLADASVQFIIRSASTCPGPGSSDCIPLKVAWESVKTVTLVNFSFSAVSSAIFIASGMACISTSNASFYQPRCVLLLFHLPSSSQTTAHPTHSSSFLAPSVQRTSPSLSIFASCIACYSSWIITVPVRHVFSIGNVDLS